MYRSIHVLVLVALVLHSAYQYWRLQELDTQLDAHVLSLLQDRAGERAEFAQAARWLHEFYQSADGLQRPHGLCGSAGEIDGEALAAWLFDVYLRARLANASEDEARRRVMEGIRASDEWQRLHVVEGSR